jgi:F-type H+-transporting ATPase subunit b
MAQTVHADGNFLVPNATFFAELVAFVLILLILWRYVVPPIQKAMRERQDMIHQEVEDSEKAKEKLAEAQSEYQRALNEARVEAAQIREGARAEAQQVVEELRTQAQEEQARIVARGEEQLQQQRTQVVRELRGEIGSLAVELSEKIVRQRLSDDAQVRATVDSFLADLEQRDAAGRGT